MGWWRCQLRRGFENTKSVSDNFRRGNHNRNNDAGEAPATIGRGSGGGTIKEFREKLKAFMRRKKVPSAAWSREKRHAADAAGETGRRGDGETERRRKAA